MAECARDPLRVLLLGVTPGIAGLQWPPGTALLAIDRSESMVRQVWPGDIPGRRRAVAGSWLSLPVADHSRDVVIGDGSVNCVRYPGDLGDLARSIHRVLRANGTLILRCFVQPAQPEDPAELMEHIADCASFHHFKMRLLMALQKSSEQGIAVNDVYRYWTSRKIDVQALAERTGWDRTDIDTIELHNGPNTVHTFPTLEEIKSVLTPFFSAVSVRVPDYPMGERCPLLVARS